MTWLVTARVITRFVTAAKIFSRSNDTDRLSSVRWLSHTATAWFLTEGRTLNHSNDLDGHICEELRLGSQYWLLWTTAMTWLVWAATTLNHNDDLARHSSDYFEPHRWVGLSQQRVFWDNDELSNTIRTRTVTTAKTLSHSNDQQGIRTAVKSVRTAVKSVKPCISMHTWFANCKTFNHEDWKKVLIWWEQQITSKENVHRFFTSGNSYHRDGYVHHRNMSHNKDFSFVKAGSSITEMTVRHTKDFYPQRLFWLQQER